jgi:hypothetical protein
LEYSGFDGATVPICTFALKNGREPNYRGGFVRLSDFRGSATQGPKTLEAIANPDCGWFYRACATDFRRIPGTPIAYWMSSIAISNFDRCISLNQIADGKSGMSSCNSDVFLRKWHEVALSRICFEVSTLEGAHKSGARWFRYNKGGGGRKWYGYNDILINWEDDGRDVKSFVVSNPRDPDTTHWSRRLFNLDCFFQKGITWSAVTSSRFSARLISESGVIPGTGSKSLYDFDTKISPAALLGFLNSTVTSYYLKAFSPTLNFEAGDVGKLPIVLLSSVAGAEISKNVDELAAIARADWDNFETSWDFRDQPLLRPGLKGATLEASRRNWETHSTAAILRMQELETENNRLFIDAYRLQDELTPDVPEEQITLVRPDRRKDVAAFLSYAVGCMMGRYSLDAPGLILANAGDTWEHYLAKVGKPFDQLTFTPDTDGIIPVLDGEWFEDDIVARTREFIRATFGEATLEENLRFIEESLGKDLRKYFLTDFYKDHIQTYKKRPIYWLFQSPKKGFSALIYLHRYTRDTVNVLLNGYLRDYLHKLRSRIEHLDHVQATGETAREKTAARKESDTLKKTLHECEDYERDIILPLAQQRIELALDDGVKVNYLKFGKALATIPGLVSKEEDG